MNTMRWVSLIGLFLLPFVAFSQQEIDWDLLASVDYDFVHSEEYKAYYSQMIPTDEITALHGQEITITGFILPISTDGEQYFLSAYPFSACFFCGGAGQESVIELKLASFDRRYTVDEVITFKGKFRLNDKPFEMSYFLDEAVPVAKEGQ